MGKSVSNSEGKQNFQKRQKTTKIKHDEPQVMARLIKLIVVKILPDYHAMLLKGFQTIIL